MAAAPAADDAVVGWVQEGAEWGALGNHCILADPRRGGMLELLNRQIKHRELLRPFALSVMLGHAHEWFELCDQVLFMTTVVPVRIAYRARILAVAHTDGGGRVQTVRARDNPRYHTLLSALPHTAQRVSASSRSADIVEYIIQ